MKVLHSYEEKSPWTNRNRMVLCLGQDGGEFTVWANFDDHQQVYNKGKSLIEACAWFLRRADEHIVTIEEALNPSNCQAAKELMVIIEKKNK